MFANQVSRRSVEAPNPNFPLGGGVANAALRNRAFMQAQTTGAGQGSVGAPITIAYIQLITKASGFFLWTASYSIAAAAATEVVTTTVQSQVGTGVVTPTNGTQVNTAGGFVPAGGSAVFNSGAGNTNLTFTGGGGAVTIENPALTIGTGAVGYNYAGSGMIYNGVTGLGFALGSNVFVTLATTNSATSRICTQINMSLVELP